MNKQEETSGNASIICDFTPLGLGIRECHATILFGPNDDPESIQISVPIPTERRTCVIGNTAFEISRYFANDEITGRLFGNAIEFKTRISRIIRVQLIGWFESINLTCAVENFMFLQQQQQNCNPTIVVFRLANVPITLQGDTSVIRPMRDQPPTPLETDYFETIDLQSLSQEEINNKLEPGWQISTCRIKFRFGNREWCLDAAPGYKGGTQSAFSSRAIITATLTTQEDKSVDLEVLADRVCDLFTLAFGKCVQWVSRGKFSTLGLSDCKCRSFPVLTYGKGAGSLVDNWERGNLRQFIHEVETAFNVDWVWWHRSIGLLAYARGTPLLEIKLSTLNTLIDRISKRVNSRDSALIDPDLPQHLNSAEFRQQLHNLLCTLSPKWDETKTESVCNTIMTWNSSPSFPNQVIQACEKLAISAPTRKRLGFRHKLIHQGEFDNSLNTTDQIIDYLQSVEGVAELMMIRLLGFTGYIHIDEQGPRWQRVEELLSS